MLIVRGLVLLAFCACTAKSTELPHADVRVHEAKPAPATSSATSSPFRIDRRVEVYETFVDVRRNDASCPVLDWRPRSKQVRFEKCQDQPLEAQAATLHELVAHLRATDGPEIDAAQLVMGTDYESYPAAVHRMIEHARTHPFDPRAAGGVHAYITKAAADRDLFPELGAIFSPRRVVLLSVEGCHYASSSDRNHAGAWLRSENIRGMNLPVGCALSHFEFH